MTYIGHTYQHTILRRTKTKNKLWLNPKNMRLLSTLTGLKLCICGMIFSWFLMNQPTFAQWVALPASSCQHYLIENTHNQLQALLRNFESRQVRQTKWIATAGGSSIHIVESKSCFLCPKAELKKHSFPHMRKPFWEYIIQDIQF